MCFYIQVSLCVLIVKRNEVGLNPNILPLTGPYQRKHTQPLPYLRCALISV